MLRSECETAQLIHCAETGDAANLRRLLGHYGLRRDYSQSPYSRTVLHRACIAGQRECVVELLKAGADPNEVDDAGQVERSENRTATPSGGETPRTLICAPPLTRPRGRRQAGRAGSSRRASATPRARGSGPTAPPRAPSPSRAPCAESISHAQVLASNLHEGGGVARRWVPTQGRQGLEIANLLGRRLHNSSALEPLESSPLGLETYRSPDGRLAVLGGLIAC